MKRILKWVGTGLGGLLALVLVAAAVLFVLGSRSLGAAHAVTPNSLDIEADSASVANGAHLASIYGCVDCHGADLSGQEMGDAPPFRLVASNLTPAGVTAGYTATDWDRAIRHGVRPDGSALFVMPAGAYNKISDEEAADLIAYLQTLPPVESEFERIEWKPMGRILAGGPIDVGKGVHTSSPPASAPPPDSTVAYGEYVASMMCAYCHGPELRGQEVEGSEIPAPDLRASAAWSRAQFHETLTTGVTPAGREMNPEVMPWTSTARMTVAEREGLRRYLLTLDS